MIKKQCLECENEYQIKNYRKDISKYCSKQCMKEHKKGLYKQIKCQGCDELFGRAVWKTKQSYKGNYCSIACYRSRSPQVEIECICGKEFKAYQSRISYYGRVYCSQECYFKNGFFGRLTNDIPEIAEYSQFVAKLRSTAKYLQWVTNCRKRDKEQCKKCNSTQNLTVHHFHSIYDFVKDHGLNKEKIEQDSYFFSIENGITLCRSCHLEEHRRNYEQDSQDTTNTK